jgi:hypothetical protein
VTFGGAFVPATLNYEIELAIARSAPAWNKFVHDNCASRGGPPLAIKYIASNHARQYKEVNDGLYIGRRNYTWGRGVYVTGIEAPLSTAIYGRVGVIAFFEPLNWRAFDARNPDNERLYLAWLHLQANYPEAVLTVHSAHWLDQFRNDFREQFHIDVVMFNPDERDASGWYTQPTDTWLAVSDWEALGHLSQLKFSSRFRDARLTIVGEEEFILDEPAFTRSPLLTISGAAPTAPADIGEAYWAHRILRVES